MSDLADLPDDIEALKAMSSSAETIALKAQLIEAQSSRQSADQLVAHLRLQILKLQRAQLGPSSERSARLLEQLELSLEDIEGDIAEDDARADAGKSASVPAHTRRQPKRGPLPEHLPRERVVIPAAQACPCCGSDKLSKLGEDITETLEGHSPQILREADRARALQLSGR
jgi:DNA repair exonuclease SbcCD ATPase subunit